MAGVSIRPVDAKRDLKRFVKVPFACTASTRTGSRR